MILDASAVLAFVQAEEGDRIVSDAFDGFVEDGTPSARISTVNWVEVAQRVTDPALRQALASLMRVEPLTVQVAERAAGLHAHTRELGLSLADRVCLALAAEHSMPVLTANRAWAGLDLGVDVRLIR